MTISVEDFTKEASAWLADNATVKKEVEEAADTKDFVWGEGEFSVSVFHSLEHDEEQELITALQDWNKLRADKGYHAISWPEEFGGLGLSKAHARAYGRLERGYHVPTSHEINSVTRGLIAPTIDTFGTDEQKARWIPELLRTDVLCSQLFSEPGAGSDLASLACRAERDGDEWVLNGQKVWSSGAQFSQWGLLIARSDPDAVKHKGMTAFMVPLDHPGVEVRPIKQMSGGSSFNEIFFSDARISDDHRVGPEGEGWKVALTTLGFERDHSEGSGDSGKVGGSWTQVLATARYMGVTADPIIRQKLMELYIHTRVEGFVNRRAADLRRAGNPPGPEGSLTKLLWTEGMTKMGYLMGDILGPSLIADTGEWGTWEWGEHVLGAPGYRIAGGSDEIQRNIIGERVLGLPGEPRVDKGIPWKEVPR